MKKFIFLAAATILAVSCGSSVKTVTYSGKSVSLPYSIQAATMTTELKVSENKVSGEAKEKDGYSLLSQFEEAAVGNALKAAGADILLEPAYEYVREDGKLISVKVTGYPASYCNFRPMTKEDADVIQTLKSKAPEIIIIKESK